MDNAIVFQFIYWFLVRFPVEILKTGENFVLWSWRFFSIGYFIPRLFSPWHKDITSYGQGFDLKVWGRAFLWNLISRFIGFFARVFLMILGLATEGFLLIAFFILVVFWYVSPFVAVILIQQAVKTLL